VELSTHSNDALEVAVERVHVHQEVLHRQGDLGAQLVALLLEVGFFGGGGGGGGARGSSSGGGHVSSFDVAAVGCRSPSRVVG
jgi:hypothetical protein